MIGWEEGERACWFRRTRSLIQELDLFVRVNCRNEGNLKAVQVAPHSAALTPKLVMFSRRVLQAVRLALTLERSGAELMRREGELRLVLLPGPSQFNLSLARVRTTLNTI